MEFHVGYQREFTIGQVMQAVKAVLDGEEVKMIKAYEELLFKKGNSFYHCIWFDGEKDNAVDKLSVDANEYEIFGWISERVIKW